MNDAVSAAPELSAWTVATPQLPPRLANDAGGAYEHLLAACRQALCGLAVTYTAPARSSYGEQAFQSTPGLFEVRLVQGDAPAWQPPERARGAGPAIDESLGCYLGGEMPVILLKVDAIQTAARQLGCSLEALAMLVLRHECGHHFAPLQQEQAAGYPGDPQVLSRAEAAAQLFAWMAGSGDGRELLDRLSARQPAAYRAYRALLGFAEARGTLAAWALCRDGDSVVVEGASPWSASEFASVSDALEQLQPGFGWSHLHDLARCAGPPGEGHDAALWAPRDDVLLWQAGFCEQLLNPRCHLARAAELPSGCFGAAYPDRDGGGTLVFQRLRAVEDVRVLSANLRACSATG